MPRQSWASLLLTIVVGASLGACASAPRQPAQASAVPLTVRTFTLGSTNVHLLGDGTNLVMIDAGYEKNAAKLEKAIRKAKIDLKQLRAIVLTHGHADHAGGASYFQKKYTAKIVAGMGDAALLDEGRNDKLCPTGVLGKARRSTDQNAKYSPTTVDLALRDPVDLKTLAGIDGQILPLPGHTPGSIVLLAQDKAFVGDLFRGSAVGSLARTHLYMCDVEGNKRDVKRLLQELAPQAQIFYVGHFGPLTHEAVTKHFE